VVSHGAIMRPRPWQPCVCPGEAGLSPYHPAAVRGL